MHAHLHPKTDRIPPFFLDRRAPVCTHLKNGKKGKAAISWDIALQRQLVGHIPYATYDILDCRSKNDGGTTSYLAKRLASSFTERLSHSPFRTAATFTSSLLVHYA